MKKTIKALLLGVLLCALLVPMLASCAKCKHEETKWEDEVAATCSVAGVRHKVCKDCGETFGREEYEISHIYEEGLCVYCGKAQYGSGYLEYREITLDGEEGYEVIGRGNSTAVNVEIPSMRNGKPVLSVKADAFKGNKTILSVHFGKNVKKIGEQAFSGCVALTSVTFHEGSELALIEGAAFLGCVGLTSFTVPVGVTELPMEAFKGCSNLAELGLHSGIIAIGENALEGCDAIVYDEENGAKYLGAEGTPHLLLAGITDTSVTAFTVPSDAKIIGTSAFLGCTKLSSVTLPEGLLSLSPYAFVGCKSLSVLTLPSTLKSIGMAAFAECTGLTSLLIPSGVEHIGERAFYKCTSLASIDLPDGIKTVGAFAFRETALTFTEQGGGKYIGNAENPHLILVDIASGLTSLAIHDNTRVVANGALASAVASELLSVTVGADAVTLGKGAFVGCTSLEELIFTTTQGWKIATVYGVNPTSIVVSNSTLTAEAITGVHKHDYWYR